MSLVLDPEGCHGMKEIGIMRKNMIIHEPVYSGHEVGLTGKNKVA